MFIFTVSFGRFFEYCQRERGFSFICIIIYVLLLLFIIIIIKISHFIELYYIIILLYYGLLYSTKTMHQGWSTRDVRQVAQFIAFGGPSFFLVLCGFMDNIFAALTCLVLATVINKLPIIYHIYIYFAPNYTSIKLLILHKINGFT